jgi:hypothetical protein
VKEILGLEDIKERCLVMIRIEGKGYSAQDVIKDNIIINGSTYISTNTGDLYNKETGIIEMFIDADGIPDYFKREVDRKIIKKSELLSIFKKSKGSLKELDKRLE